MKTTEIGLEYGLCQDWTLITMIFSNYIFSPHLSTTVKYEEIKMNKSRRTKDRHFRKYREQQRSASKRVSQKKRHIDKCNYVFPLFFCTYLE